MQFFIWFTKIQKTLEINLEIAFQFDKIGWLNELWEVRGELNYIPCWMNSSDCLRVKQ